MRLLEFQAKHLFRQFGIPVPQGQLISSPLSVSQLTLPVVLKAQVPVGGRGKAGGIRKVNTTSEAKEAADAIFALNIRGCPVSALLAEELVNNTKEMYLAVLYDKKSNLPVIMASAAGGIEIEQAAKANPDAVLVQPVDLIAGIQPYIIRRLARHLGLVNTKELADIVDRLYRLLTAVDATLVEINPLVKTEHGLVALDGKVMLDDRAEFYHEELYSELKRELINLEQGHLSTAELLAARCGITYVPLSGNIGMIADGAGTGMLTLDLIQDEGGAAANFCEMGGAANAEVMRQAIEVVLAKPGVDVLLITLIGGLTRMDEIADGIAGYLNNCGSTVPFVVRMCGTQEDVGRATLQQVGVEIHDDMVQAVQSSVLRAKGLFA
jgi:succinyl-CoA synthetase beta subunit